MKKLCALLILVLWATSAQAARQTLVVYNWSEYIPQEVLTDFTKETGIRVSYATFESNEALFAKIKLQRGKGYDVIVPSSYFIDLLREAGLLDAIDKSKIPNLSNIDPRVMGKPFDPENTYSVPYMWGSAGLVVNKKHIDPATVTSWKDLLRPEYKGRVLLSDDLRDTLGIALKATGHSINSKSEAEIKEAAEFLQKLYPSVRVFDVAASKQTFVTEEVHIGMMWNGDSLVAAESNPDLTFIYPQDGAVLWLDSFAIPKHAANKEAAHIFINYMLRPDVAKRCVEAYMYSTPNLEAIKLLPADLRENRVLLPTEEDLKNSEFLNSVGNALPVYEKYWKELKTGISPR